MADCSYIAECDLYHDRLDIMPMTAEFIKMTYCHKEYEDCVKFLSLSHEEAFDAHEELMTQDFTKSDGF